MKLYCYIICSTELVYRLINSIKQLNINVFVPLAVTPHQKVKNKLEMLSGALGCLDETQSSTKYKYLNGTRLEPRGFIRWKDGLKCILSEMYQDAHPLKGFSVVNIKTHPKTGQCLSSINKTQMHIMRNYLMSMVV